MPKTKAVSQPRQAGPEHRKLAVFVGTWNLRGRQFETPSGRAAEITGTETYEWLTGGLFLIHRFEARLGNAQAACIEITGYDPSTRRYPTHTFYNDGQIADWQLQEQGEGWLITGKWSKGGEEALVRCTVELGDEGNSRTSTWQSSSDGRNWDTFWEVMATRA